jgi:hypothetical protein
MNPNIVRLPTERNQSVMKVVDQLKEQNIPEDSGLMELAKLIDNEIHNNPKAKVLSFTA